MILRKNIGFNFLSFLCVLKKFSIIFSQTRLFMLFFPSTFEMCKCTLQVEKFSDTIKMILSEQMRCSVFSLSLVFLYNTMHHLMTSRDEGKEIICANAAPYWVPQDRRNLNLWKTQILSSLSKYNESTTFDKRRWASDTNTKQYIIYLYQSPHNITLRQVVVCPYILWGTK